MKKIILKILFILSFVIFVGNIKCYGSFLNPSNSITSGDYKYFFNDSNSVIIEAYLGNAINLTTPTQIDGYDVVGIDLHAFDENRVDTHGKQLVNLVISEGVTQIGDYAFVDCIDLENVTLPNSLTSLGLMSFLGCTSLKHITVPPNLTQINDAFENSGLEDFVVPETVKNLKNMNFRGCRSLKKFIVYSKDAVFPSPVPVHRNNEVTMEIPDTFEYCSEDLVIYGYLGSTAEEFANAKNYTFKNIETLNNGEAPEISPTKVPISTAEISPTLTPTPVETSVPVLTPSVTPEIEPTPTVTHSVVSFVSPTSTPPINAESATALTPTPIATPSAYKSKFIKLPDTGNRKISIIVLIALILSLIYAHKKLKCLKNV